MHKLLIMNKPNEMTSLAHVLEKLRLKKIDNEFTLTENGFTVGEGKCYKPEELKIIKVYRFEGDSDPADESVIYIIEANDGLIGYSMGAYGMNSDKEPDYNNFLRQIQVEDREDQQTFEI